MFKLCRSISLCFQIKRVKINPISFINLQWFLLFVLCSLYTYKKKKEQKNLVFTLIWFHFRTILFICRCEQFFSYILSLFGTISLRFSSLFWLKVSFFTHFPFLNTQIFNLISYYMQYLCLKGSTKYGNIV